MYGSGPKRSPIVMLLALELALFGSSGCGSDLDPSVGVQEGAGFPTIEPAWTDSDTWRIGTQPTFVVGTANGPSEYALADVRGATTFADGRIAVADNSARQIKFFSATGEYIGSSGREGSGPGEYRSIVAMTRTPSDTLLVADLFLRRITVLDATGEFVRSISLPSSGRITALVAVSDTNAVFISALAMDARTRPDGMYQDTVPVFLLDLATEEMQLAGHVTVAQYISKKLGEGQSTGRLAPFASPGYVAAAAGRFVIAASADDDVRIYSPDGTETAVLQHVRPMPSVGVHEIRAYYHAWYPDGDAAVRLARTGFADVGPPRMPAFDGVAVGPDGNVWVRRFDPPWDLHRSKWDVHGSDGRWLGTVELPVDRHVDWRTKDLLEVGDDHVLVLLTDTIGVQRVGRFELTRGMPSS